MLPAASGVGLNASGETKPRIAALAAVLVEHPLAFPLSRWQTNLTMNTNRREFFKLAAVSTIAAAASPTVSVAANAAPAKTAHLRLSCQDGVAPGKDLSEKFDFLESLGFEGVEWGGGGLPGRVEGIQKALQGRKLKTSAICAGFSGCLISEKDEDRKKAVASIKEILTAAGALGSTGMIVVPAFNGQTKLGHWEAREVLVETLADLGEHALKAGTTVLLEPLNRQEAHFLRQVADAAEICKNSKSAGACVMGDFWHMTWEEPDDMAAFLAAGERLRHVHMASRKSRRMPGEDEGDHYVNGFKGLKFIGYDNFVSFECGCKGDRKAALTTAVKLLREQWQMA